MDGLPSGDLELKAADERRRLEGSLRELRARLEYDFDIKRRVQNNLGLASGVAVIIGLVSGYWITGAFTR